VGRGMCKHLWEVGGIKEGHSKGQVRAGLFIQGKKKE